MDGERKQDEKNEERQQSGVRKMKRNEEFTVIKRADSVVQRGSG